MKAEAVVFDLGGVLIDWNPRHLYRPLFFGDEVGMERFLSTVCTQAWNEEQDAGRPFEEGCRLLSEQFPEHAELIHLYDRDWHKMINGSFPQTVAILAALKDRGVPLYALSNWSAEKFHHATERFDFLGWFNGVVISGPLLMKKPDPRIFRHLTAAYGLTPTHTVYIDDSKPNVDAASALGFLAHHFSGAAALSAALEGWGMRLT